MAVFKCGLCDDVSYHVQSRMERHLKTVHKDDFKFDYQVKRQIKAWQSVAEKPAKEQCNYCHNSYNASYLREHVKICPQKPASEAGPNSAPEGAGAAKTAAVPESSDTESAGVENRGIPSQFHKFLSERLSNRNKVREIMLMFEQWWGLLGDHEDPTGADLEDKLEELIALQPNDWKRELAMRTYKQFSAFSYFHVGQEGKVMIDKKLEGGKLVQVNEMAFHSRQKAKSTQREADGLNRVEGCRERVPTSFFSIPAPVKAVKKSKALPSTSVAPVPSMADQQATPAMQEEPQPSTSRGTGQQGQISVIHSDGMKIVPASDEHLPRGLTRMLRQEAKQKKYSFSRSRVNKELFKNMNEDGTFEDEEEEDEWVDKSKGAKGSETFSDEDSD